MAFWRPTKAHVVGREGGRELTLSQGDLVMMDTDRKEYEGTMESRVSEISAQKLIN